MKGLWELGILILALTTTTHSLHEDQVGKFDWHQKLIGPIRFLFNDPHQPKRILVGGENNVIAALHANTGNLLYRQLLESSGRLVYFACHEERETLAVSIQEPNLVKIRTFQAPTGIIKEEWVTQAPSDLVTHQGKHVYLIQTNKFPSIILSTFSLVKDEPQPLTKNTLTLPNSVPQQDTNEPVNCQVTGIYLLCSQGPSLSILNLQDSSFSTSKFEAHITDLRTSGPGEISSVVVQGADFQRIFILLENSKAGPELLPLTPSSSSNLKFQLSQFKTDDRSILFLSKQVTAHSVQVEGYNRMGQMLEGSSFAVTASMPLSSLVLSKGYVLNSRYGLVGVTKDELVFGTKADGSPSETQLPVEWSREESLASVIQVEMVDYPSEVGPTWNPYLASLNVLSAFISRLKYEAEAILTGESLYSSAEDRFGLRKVIVFATAVGKVVGMDSKSGNILYTFFLPDFSLFPQDSWWIGGGPGAGGTAFLYIQRPAKYTPLKPQATIIYQSKGTKNTLLFAFDPVQGKSLDELKTFPPLMQTQMLHHAGEETEFIKPILLMDKERNVHVYPPTTPSVQSSYFFVVNNKDPKALTLEGCQVRGTNPSTSGQKLEGKLLWTLSFGNSEVVGVHGKLGSERVHSQGRVLPDRSVSYKYMNPNLVAVVTAEREQGNINIYLIDAVSGAVIHSLWHKKCGGPVHVVHSEHWLVYSLFNEKNRRYEVNSVELYEGQRQSNSSAFSSFAAPPVEPIVVKQSYIFPTAIQHLAHTRTEKGITNKDILIALPGGGILELPRMILQPRLSQQHYTQQIHTDEDGVIHSIPYLPELPIPSEMILNYNQTVKRVHGIKTWPTRLESTSLVLVHGSDLYYNKLTPSKTFDVLKDDFDYLFITVVLVGLILAAYITKRLAARKQLDQAWK